MTLLSVMLFVRRMYIEQKQGYGKKMDHQIPVSRTMGIVTHQVLLTRMNTQVINFPFIALFYDISPSSFLLFICAPLFQFLFHCSQEKMPTQISHKSNVQMFFACNIFTTYFLYITKIFGINFFSI